MKFFLVTILFFLTTITCLSQNNVDSLITGALLKKETSYFKLQQHFKRARFTDNQIKNLLEESKKSNYVIGEIFAKKVEGRLFRNITEYDKAVESYNEALRLAKEIESKEAEIVILNQLGVVYRRQDKIRSALNNHQAALEIVTQIESPNEDIKKSNSITINSIGNIYLALKQYGRALEKFNQSILIQDSLDDKRGLAINHQNIGYAYKNIGDLDLALENYQKSLRYNTLNNDKLGKVICHNSIADVLIQKGKYNEAYQYIAEVVASAEEISNRYYLSEVYNTYGWVSIKLNKDEDAEDYLERALKIGLENNILSSLTLSYAHLSELNQKKENYKKALEYYHKSIDVERRTYNNKNVRYVNSLIDRYDSEVNTNKIKDLAKENEITKLKLLRNRNILIIALVSIALFGVLLYSIYRQRLLKNDKQILLLEQDALRIQMNPHFVFNALNSIKLYIINNEQKNAVRYLNKFSKLIRSILESSTVKEVNLAEELKTMTLYMSIENIRFSNAIVYEEKISSIVNLEVIKIPPLILQPFLENAIWHGLSSKKGDKKVVLSVEKISDEFVQIDIVDNGIGRKEAFRIKSNKTLNRKSIGIDLTKERLMNFSSQFQNDYSLVYVDLLDESGNVKGTKVSLKLPLI
ncbi:tetratricopeptide repeat-containing sensor histidine kinase [Tenacibaculum bernardetii]|uniref:tetratricopeptide repeat-containing sensor histidine kinase n=1 Tax=Tenacibaculum bernardetii TaxID=3021375 RepID=UPI0023B07008|nr:tetratricopeptide repeat protein [Tenacibaculum bernardetii]